MDCWSNAQVFEFLELYSGEPAIWDPKHPHHKNKKKVQDSWSRLSSCLNIPVNELKAKKNSLMATFRFHRRRKEASIESGAGEYDVYQPIWFAYEKMEDFLGPVYKCARTRSTMDEDDDAVLSIPPVVQHQNGIDESGPSEQHQNEIDESGPSDDEKQTDEGTQLNINAMLRQSAAAAAAAAAPTPPPSTTTTHQEKRRQIATEIFSASDQIQHTFDTLNNALNARTATITKETDDCELYGQLVAMKLRNYSMQERYHLMYEIDGLFLRKPPHAMSSPRSQGSN